MILGDSLQVMASLAEREGNVKLSGQTTFRLLPVSRCVFVHFSAFWKKILIFEFLPKCLIYNELRWRRRRESNPRMTVLQTIALPLGYSAIWVARHDW
jgi:hypothetical protein